MLARRLSVGWSSMSTSSLGVSTVQYTVIEVPVRFLRSSSSGGSDWTVCEEGV